MRVIRRRIALEGQRVSWEEPCAANFGAVPAASNGRHLPARCVKAPAIRMQGGIARRHHTRNSRKPGAPFSPAAGLFRPRVPALLRVWLNPSGVSGVQDPGGLRRRGVSGGSALGVPVDTPRPWGRLEIGKKRVFSRGSAFLAFPPRVVPARELAHRSAAFARNAGWEGGSSMIAPGVSASISLAAGASHLRVLPFHSNGRRCLRTSTLLLAWGRSRGLRHGPCLLVHQDDESPAWGPVNEEMSA